MQLPETYEAPSNGYIVVYLSNESEYQTDVYFDDLQVTVTESKVIQTDDYYPFGLAFNSWQRSTNKENKLNTFQDQELITDLDLNWVQFKWRNHMPDIGRFFNVDPLSESFYYNSTYAFSENKVIAHLELEGAEAMDYRTHMTLNGGNPGAAAVTYAADWLYDKIIGGGVRMAQGAHKYANNEQNHSEYQRNGPSEYPAEIEQQVYETTKVEAATEIAEGMVDQLEGYTTLQGVAMGGVEGTLETGVVNTSKNVVKPNKSIYYGLKDSKSVGAGKKFTAAQKRNMLNANRKANGGVLRSDMSGQLLDAPVQSRKGVPANMNQAEVDHVIPRSKGGKNSYGNAQILSKTENVKKRDN